MTRTASDIDDSVLYQPRATRDEMMARIYTDLDIAGKYLPLPSEMSGNDYGRITKTAAMSMKARAALYEGTRRKYHGIDDGKEHLKIAYEVADSVMQTGEYSLWTEGTEPYKSLFDYAGEGASEYIFVCIFASST